MGVEFTQSGNDIVVREDEAELTDEELAQIQKELRENATPEQLAEDERNLAKEYRNAD